MSHAVTVTRTTTTVTTTSAILLNTGHLKTMPGILKLLQVAIGCVIVGLLGHYLPRHASTSSLYNLVVPELFLLLIATACLIATTCILVSCLLSISTATILAKTMFELIYHGVSFGLYLASSIYMLVIVTQSRYSLDPIVAAGSLGVVNTVLYLISTYYSYRSYSRA